MSWVPMRTYRMSCKAIKSSPRGGPAVDRIISTGDPGGFIGGEIHGQRCNVLRLANPADRFDYTAALIQFVLSNPLIDAALVGMRTPDEVDANVETWRNEAGRIDLTALWTRYVET